MRRMRPTAVMALLQRLRERDEGLPPFLYWQLFQASMVLRGPKEWRV